MAIATEEITMAFRALSDDPDGGTEDVEIAGGSVGAEELGPEGEVESIDDLKAAEEEEEGDEFGETPEM